VSVVVYSGGLDSTVALTEMVKLRGVDDVLALSFDYGQRHARRELAAAGHVAAGMHVEHHVIDLRTVGALLAGSALTDSRVAVPEGHYAEASMAKTIVPNRNMMMISCAAAVAAARGHTEVVTAVHAGDHFVYPDCRPGFIDAMNDALGAASAGSLRPVVSAPYLHLTKARIVARGYEMGAPMHLSWSCYEGGRAHCGRCGTCVERAAAFAEAEVADSTLYEDPHYFRTVKEPESFALRGGAGGVST
jgi:7-cyano-7-deazaguanine synthase